MEIKIIETETGDVLTRADTDNMRLPFERGWASWGVSDARTGYCLDSYPTYAQADELLSFLIAPALLAA